MGTVSTAATKSRDLETLLKDFEKSAGNFKEFNLEMDAIEKELFKTHLASLRPPK